MVDLISATIHFIDGTLVSLFDESMLLAYAFLFFLIFIETGIVISPPFLPGDSLLFLAGVLLASKGLWEVGLLFILLVFAAILGDSVNYSIGKYFGKKIIARGLIRQQSIDKAKEYFRRKGGKTIILARFIPLIRTVAPFVAGIGSMEYKKFLFFNIVGGFFWVLVTLGSGYFFGNLPIVKENLVLITILIVISSGIPIVYDFIAEKIRSERRLSSP